MSKSVFVIDTPKDCLHCKMRTCLHINDKHYQLCGLQIPHYGYGTEAFFKDDDLLFIETGIIMHGFAGMKLPKNVIANTQTLLIME